MTGGWAITYRGLRQLTGYRGRMVAEAMQRLEAQGGSTTYFTTPDQELAWWEFLRELMPQAHIFEFDQDTTLLLRLTDNGIAREPSEIKLPYPVTFLDAQFELPGRDEWGQKLANRYVGILLYQVGHLDGIAGRKYEAPHVTCVAFMHDPDLDFVTDIMYHLTGPGVGALQRWYASLGAIEPGAVLHTTRYGAMELKAVNNLTLNFLDLLETPDAMIVRINRRKSNLRRQRQGFIPLPEGSRVVLRSSIRRYIYEVKSGGHFQYGHAFWVRGHFRRFRDQRYAASGLQGQKIWVKPFVKGKGILIKKPYWVGPGSGPRREGD